MFNTIQVKKANWVESLVLVRVRTLREVNLVNWNFSMFTSLTSRFKLNLFKGPEIHILAFNYGCVVPQHVIEISEVVSCDSELIKANRRKQKILLFQFNPGDPTFIQKSCGTFFALIETPRFVLITFCPQYLFNCPFIKNVFYVVDELKNAMGKMLYGIFKMKELV